MHSNLTPTPIVDVNGKPTTVHKKTAAVSPSSAALATVRPALASAKKKQEKGVRVEYMMTQMPANEGLLWEMGTGLGTHKYGLGVDPDGFRSGSGGGSSILTMSEMFRYMRHGATFHEAARLSRFKNIDEWEQDEDFQRASALCHTKFEKTIDLVESKDMKIGDAFKLLGNGISDELLERSILTEEQTLSIFKRFKYTHFTASKTANETPAMVNALLDGRLPYAVFDGGYDKINVTKMCKELFGSTNKKVELTEDERNDLLSNPETITLVLDLIASQKQINSYEDPFRNTGLTYRAFKHFGEEAVRRFRPEILLSERRDGSLMGLDGAVTAYTFMDYCSSEAGMRCRHYSPVDFNAKRADGSGFSIKLADAADLAHAGLDDATIVHLLADLNLTVDQALEQAKSSPAPILLEGIL